jgi:class 3 adenylate cyclase/tetratricopeptide (TPR) repeat protein
VNEIQQVEQAINSLEAQRELLGDTIVDLALEPLKQKLATLRNIPQEPKSLDERKLVTVMFADLSGFTALSEKLDPERVREIMNGCFNVLVPIIERYGGTIDKFIGDEIMALFGAPIARENDAEMALRASLDMMEALNQFNQDQGLRLGMHFGINTGVVVAGGLGSEYRQQYSVMGDAVNLAARLEGASESGQIFIGPTTYKLTAPYFEFDILPPISLKGKSQPVQIYLLKSIKKYITRERGFDGLFSPIIGREKDMGRIEVGLENLDKGKAGVFFLLGEAGMGKSRLVLELCTKFSRRFQWFEGRAFAHTESVSYKIVNSLLDDILKVEKDTPPHIVSEILESFLEQKFLNQSTQRTAYLSRLRGLPLKQEFEEIFKDVMPSTIQVRMWEAFAQLITQLAKDSPLVLVWEDLHWADASSIQLLQHILQVSKKLPIFFLIVSRTQENISEWFDNLTQLVLNPEKLELSPLSAEQSAELLENLLKIDNLPSKTLEMILSKSEGNPFFLEELLRSLIETGMVILDSGRFTVSDKIQDLQVPDTLQGVIAARIDRLPATSKHTLQNASVIGRIFQDSVLKLIIEQETPRFDIDQSLNELLKKTLIRNRESEEYIFKHAITHDVTYQSLLISRRKALHLLTAKSMEDIFPEQLDELAPSLAFHFSLGGEPSKASNYFQKAAEKAEQNYSNREALNLYLKAVEEIKKKEDGIQIKELEYCLEKIGEIYSLLGETAEALRALDQALANLDPKEIFKKAQIIRKKGLAFNAARNFPKMIENYQDSEQLLGEFSEANGQMWIEEWIDLQLDLAWAYYFGNKVPELDETINRVNPIIEKFGNLVQKNRLYGTLFLSDLRRFRYFQLPDFMIERLNLQLDTAKQIGNKALIGRALAKSGFARMWRNEHDLAEEIFLESFKDIEHVGDMDSLLISKTYIALAMRKKGDLSKTITYAEASLNLAKSVNSHYYIGASYSILGWASWKLGNREKADQFLRSAIEAYKLFPGSNPIEFLYKGPLMGMAVEEENWEKAVEYSKSFLDSSQQRMPEGAYKLIEFGMRSWEKRDLSATKDAFHELLFLLKKEQTGYA